MKQVIICICIFIFIVLLDMWTQNYTKESVAHITDNLNMLKDNVIEEEKEKSQQQLDRTIRDWDERYEYLSYYIEHNELEKVKTELVELKANIETEEYHEAATDIETSIFILEHIKQKTSVQIKNIF